MLYKGPDRARIHVHRSSRENEYDEIDAYWDTRYVCAPEAAHRILGFDMSKRSDTVVRLQIHLPNFESIPFKIPTQVETPKDGKKRLSKTVKEAKKRMSTLTALFALNKACQDAVTKYGSIPEDMLDSRQFRYHEMPERFVFKKKPGAESNQWHIRERGGEKTRGCMYFVSPQDNERFALRLLLLYGKGFTSFEDVRTIDGILFPSFVEAARATWYLKDDGYFRSAMQEAVALRMPKQLRSFFVSLIVFADMKPPLPAQ